ncbi:FAD dependent oxidoreductase [Annulohypoxylon truncatum]|uniref:FAD dependent oxidoreductase n=1 Tax=Annulohypoxylon truncatum TaxID=327061 RepID=UPI0020073E2A|nr:FAD dependent oxidoreductase [Annulohypoxylon truncatum]KAI1208283.1 FAD dependent oxidoreductase [Annulohypoxylon truncatum]
MLNPAPLRLLTTSTRRTMASTPKDITIIGGGIIGCCTAYFLTRHPSYSPDTHRITLLEASSSSAGGRTPESIQDPATLADPTTASRKNPAHDGIAGGASGKAGGLLALWAFPSEIVPLSFRLHSELAKEHGGDKRWGYRRCYASQIDCRARLPPGFDSGVAGETELASGEAEQRSKGLHKDHKTDIKTLQKLGAPEDLDWLDTEEALAAYEVMSTPDKTAQVHPELFTRSMAQLAEEQGAKIVTGARVTTINKTADGKSVESVTYIKDGKEEVLPATDCVVAAGPWTRRLLPNVPVTAARAHSVVIKTPRPISAYALFTSILLPTGFPTPTPQDARRKSTTTRPLIGQQIVEPEIYARPDGTAYACGPTDNAVELPLTSADVEVDTARCDDIIYQVGGISDELGKDGQVLAKQACYLPQGGPWIGKVDNTEGLVVAAGHTCWGIQNAPATGKLVSEIILEGKAKSAKLGSCDPARMAALWR